MKLPDTWRGRKAWTDRDKREIERLASGLRQRGAPNDASAIMAAEEEYVRSGQSAHGIGGLVKAQRR